MSETGHNLAKEVIPVHIEDELKRSYLDYAMSVIVGRALPDVRDGLKPVHRRVLYAMSEMGNDANKPYKKSARIVGDVMGKYHPHGEMAIYDTIVRMAQPFAQRYILIDGQGNFGSIDGDSAAAMRYTEIRLARITHELLADLEKETVNFVPNYDGNDEAPEVLPTRVPNLLINGSSGIAVGMATNIPPHNLNEVCDACIALIQDPSITLEKLMSTIPGPDFPTGAIINGRAGILEAYRTGRGRIYVRAKTHIETEEKTDKQTIVVTELPYQVNKARLIEKIAELVKDKKIDGVTALRDESDKEGMRIVIELKRGELAEVLLNNLYNQTQFQTVFGINLVALIDGQPKCLNLKQILEAFIRHRKEVVTRRTLFDLRKAREQGHILEGLGVALANIDVMVALIKSSSNPQEAKEKLLGECWQAGVVVLLLADTDALLCKPEDLSPDAGLTGDRYRLSPRQAQAILDLRLHRLTGLEQEKIINEYKELLVKIKDHLETLSNREKLLNIIQGELADLKQRFGDDRLTEILSDKQDLTNEDLIIAEEQVVTLSHEGYIKSQGLDAYHAQRRGGRGKAATSVKDSDFIERLIIANSHDNLLCFSNRGKVYWLRVYQLPKGNRVSRGRPIVNLLSLGESERIHAILPVKIFSETEYIVMATARGTIKKTPLSEFSRPRANGIIAIELAEGDQLVSVALTDGTKEIMMFTDAGKVIRFKESAVRSMGRTARGVRGIKLKASEGVIACLVTGGSQDIQILTATQHGYGKRTPVGDYRISGRGGQGVIAIQVNQRNGSVVGAMSVSDADELMLISNRGTLVRLRALEISTTGRNTQGVRLINLGGDEMLVGMQRIEDIDES